MARHHQAISSFSLYLLLFLLCSASIASEKAATVGSVQGSGKPIWVWADEPGGENAIFMSRYVAETWEKPQKISANKGVNIVPAVANPAVEDLMVIWSTYTGSQAQLHYRQFKNGLWTEEKEYYTGLSSNTAPSIAVDQKGKIWVVWAGFNGISDDIYYTTWNTTSFATATALTANDVPDIQPIISIDDETGSPVLQWMQFSDSGYRKLESAWNGSKWSAPILASANKSSGIGQASMINQRTLVVTKANNAGTSENNRGQTTTVGANEQLEIEIPSFITNPESASIHIPGHAVQSLPIRSIITIE
jgi:hypothetical protein